ncbi:hypothetical protein B0J18DRAFT_470617 [Chaetomium sp. MPI-SDFR-AT-0129]|nr:hypothetical protein B0J18DRAFT_470617 [Chaetomium sp. MPI-SDFR-AT-0129]
MVVIDTHELVGSNSSLAHSVTFVQPQNYQSPCPSSHVPSEVSPNGSIDYLPVHGANSPTTTSIIEDVESEYENGYEPELLREDAALRRYIADPSRHERLALGIAIGLAAARELGEQIAPTSMPIHPTEQGTGSSISLSPCPNAEDEGGFENDNDIMSEVARERLEARRRRAQIGHKPRSLKEPKMRKRSAGSSRGEKQKVARTK